MRSADQTSKPEANIAIAEHVTRELSLHDFDHTAWAGAPPVQITHYWSGADAPKERQAEARLLWSETSLLVRYVCPQAEPLVIASNPQTEKKTIGLWDRDVCEIFLAPDPNVVERYFEFEAAPTGEWIDLAIHWTPEKRETDWDFHSGMTAGARVEKNRVAILMRIPWDDWIHKPQSGERWRANLFRCVGKGDTRGYLAWQPTRLPEPAFHLPSVFGWLLFQ